MQDIALYIQGNILVYDPHTVDINFTGTRNHIVYSSL